MVSLLKEQLKKERFYEKKFITKVLPILPNGKLDLKEVSGLENKNLDAGGVIYIYIGDKNVYIGQTKKLKKRHLQHCSKQDSIFNMNNYQQVICLFGELVNKNLDYSVKDTIKSHSLKR